MAVRWQNWDRPKCFIPEVKQSRVQVPALLMIMGKVLDLSDSHFSH